MNTLIVGITSWHAIALRTILLVAALGITPTTYAIPNIIFVLADDLGWGDVGFNGQQHIQTPNLDQMARDGIVFSQHYAGSTVCMPSRCCLMTGKHTGHATIRGNPRWTRTGKPVDLGPSDTTVAEELKRAGYRTAVIGKWGLAEADDAGMPLRQGFDSFFGYRRHVEAHSYYPNELWRDDTTFIIPENKQKGASKATTRKGMSPVVIPVNHPKDNERLYSHDMLVDEALQVIDSAGNKPFFLYLALTIPHLELTVPANSKTPYEKLGWPRRAMHQGGHYKNDPEGNTAYAGMISRMDRDVGRLRKQLEEHGLADDTLIIFTSDNGPEFERKDRFFNSNGPLRGGKRDLYEGGIRVPFVAVWPNRIMPGGRSDHPSAFWDLLPTLCEIVGITPTDSQIDGLSFLPSLVGDPASQREHEYLYWEFNEKAGPIQAVRFSNWKAVRYLDPSRSLELYNLDKDIGETRNVALEHPQLVKQAELLFDKARDEHSEFDLTTHRKAPK